MTNRYDVAIAGSGFAGSLLAMIARRLGLTAVLLERGAHPRFAIGESSTPLANLLLEELAARYNLPAIAAFSKYGTWGERYPHIACGLKRGFSFFHHDLDRPSDSPPARERQLLVAASPNDRVSDTHWFRPEFDAEFLRQARELGVEYFDHTELSGVQEQAAGIALTGSSRGAPLEIHARFLVDATGPRGFLHRAIALGEAAFPGYPQTCALYSHFRHVGRFADCCGTATEGAPYPIDAAAVHHVFPGGWIWVLQFENGVTSAGVAATREAASLLHLAEGEPAWNRLLHRIPLLQRQFLRAVPTRDFTFTPRLSFRAATLVGRRWVLAPSAAGFVDPLLSTGFPLTLLGIARIARIWEAHWPDGMEEPLHEYAAATDAELCATASLVGALYANLGRFPAFRSIAMLYFAAAAYSETVKRLGKHHLATGFLLHNHQTFGPACRQLLSQANQLDPGALSARIDALIQPFDVAGLCDHSRNGWFPVDPRDLFAAAPRLNASQGEIQKLVARCFVNSYENTIDPVMTS